MQPQVFERFQELVYREAGIALREGKGALVAARIAKRMRDLGLEDEREYLGYLESDGDGTEMVHFLDAITTNFTSFYRESDHFGFLADEAKEWGRSGARERRVWCAAAATGEEPYTIAMTLREALRGTATDFRLLATDISRRALEFAAHGSYEESRLAQVPAALRKRYFAPYGATARGERSFVVDPSLSDRILWKRLNLSAPPFPLRGELDAIFCRNVMIYFDHPVRQRLVSELVRLLRPGGLLVVAHSETLGGLRSDVKMIRPSVYRKEAP
jgi:chemotaxis protein methyltransferase CheR